MTNMVLLGGLLANLPVLTVELIEKALEEHLPRAASQAAADEFQGPATGCGLPGRSG